MNENSVNRSLSRYVTEIVDGEIYTGRESEGEGEHLIPLRRSMRLRLEKQHINNNILLIFNGTDVDVLTMQIKIYAKSIE